MFNFSRINCVLAQQSLHNQTSRQTSRLFLNIAQKNFRRNDKIVKLSSSTAGVYNRCRSTESVVSLNQSTFSLYSEKKDFISRRNFSASSTLWSWMPSNQNKEKVANYVYLGTILVSVIFVIYMVQTMEYHQDYVHIEPSEKKK